MSTGPARSCYAPGTEENRALVTLQDIEAFKIIYCNTSIVDHCAILLYFVIFLLNDDSKISKQISGPQLMYYSTQYKIAWYINEMEILFVFNISIILKMKMESF